MRLPRDSVISERKLKEYLLTSRVEDDKLGFLALAGYAPENWRELDTGLRQQLDQDAQLIRTTDYGEMYQIRGQLIGPNGKALNIVTIWIRLRATGETRFVTLVPDKEAGQ